MLKWLFCVFVAVVGARGAELEWKSFRGMCDASAVEMLTDDLFVAGNDEDNVLRIYSRARQGLPVQVADFSGFFRQPKKSKEMDLEGAARIDDRIYWISSHGSNAKGKFQPTRHRFFAAQIVTNKGVVSLRPAGQLYGLLARDLVREPALARFNLAAAAQRAPKEKDALNIEALAATPDKRLLIGFRNPIPEGKAMIVPLENPAEVIAGRRARFGQPIFLDLGGLGLRSMISVEGGYLMIGGEYDSGGTSRLYHWNGQGEPKVLVAKLPGNPEGIALSGEKLFVMNDDGSRKMFGGDCKKLKNSNLQSFRAYELPLPEPEK